MLSLPLLTGQFTTNSHCQPVNELTHYPSLHFITYTHSADYRYAVARCPSVRPSVRHTRVFYPNG